MNQLPGIAEMLEKIASGAAVEGMESLMPLLAEQMVSVICELPAGSRLILLEPERIAAHAQSLEQTTAEFLAAAWSNAAAGGEIPVNVNQASFASLRETREFAASRKISWWKIGGFANEETIRSGIREPKTLLEIRMKLSSACSSKSVTDGGLYLQLTQWGWPGGCTSNFLKLIFRHGLSTSLQAAVTAASEKIRKQQSSRPSCILSCFH
ncbi:hypothetical protein RQN30_09635 [Arcanobacterium hippocoleae]